MIVEILNQTTRIQGVTNIIVTEAVDDGEGGFVREIRIFGPDPDAVHVTRVQGVSKDAIALTTPALDF